MSHTSLPGPAPFEYLVNPTGRQDGYTKVLTANEPADLALATLPSDMVLLAQEVVVDFDIVMAAGDPAINLRPNGLAVGNVVFKQWVAGGATPGSANVASLQMGSPNDADTVIFSGRLSLQTRIGQYRRFKCESVSYTAGALNRAERKMEQDGFWIDSTTALTSLVINRSVANTIRAGSRFRVTLKG